MVDQVLKLQEKRQLTASDAFSVIQLLQEQAIPIFSLRNASLQPTFNVSSAQSKTRHSQLGRRRERLSPNQRTHKPSLDQRVSPRGDSTPAGTIPAAAPLQLDSVEEFPPIGLTVNTTPRNRKKSRGGPRRITPTPLQLQSATNGGAGGGTTSDLKPNPVFTSACLTSELPSLMSEERRLLQQERMKSNAKHNAAESSEHSMDATPRQQVIFGETKHSAYNNPHSSANPNSQRHSQSSSPHNGVPSALSSPSGTSTGLLLSSPILSPDKVKFKQELTQLSELYAQAIMSGLVPNISSELHFTIQLLTTSIPLSATDQLIGLIDSDKHIFTSEDACVYFAVSVLHLTRHLYTSLDKTTLQLLGDNTRIKTFNPELSEFFLSASERTQERSSGVELHSLGMTGGRGHVGIPFVEETDNSKNFTSMRAFHAFKRQRDGFYSLYRDWRAHHDTQGWSMHTELGDRIRILVSQSADTCSHAYLARLFQCQLVESCQHSLDPFFSLNSGLAGPLKMADPMKLLRLTERLVHRSSHGGVCPRPSFTGDEEFFKGFVIAADSYTFNHHLMSSIHSEILKLQTSSVSLSEQALLPAINTLRVLGKFLGLLVFLPHQLPAPLSLAQVRNMPVDLLPCIKEAQQKSHLCTTVPWVVEYCSMMDTQALSAGVVNQLMETLVHVYRSCVTEKNPLSRSTFLVLACLGWLFEVTGLTLSQFASYLTKCSPDINITDQEQLSCVSSVSVDILYSCCPYLSELRSLLLEFSAGTLTKPSPLRKIKPSSAEMVSDESSKRKTHHLRQLFEENFFRSHPSYVKQLCEVVSERSSSSAIAHFESVVVDELCQPLLSSLTSWLLNRGENGKLSSLHDSDVDRKLLVVCDNAVSTARTTAEQFFKNYCNSLAKRGVEGVMESRSARHDHPEVSAVVTAIATQWALDRCHKWTTDKMRDCVCGHLMKSFDKLHRSIAAVYNMSEVVTAGFGVSHPVSLLPTVPIMSSRDCPELTLDVDSSSDVMATIQRILIKPALLDEDLSQIQLCLSTLCQHLHRAVSPLPNLYCQQLLPKNTRNLLIASFDLAVKLVISRVWTRPPLDLLHVHKEEDSSSMSCFINLLQLWHLLRKCRMELPVEKLLSADVVHSFTNTQLVAKEGVSIWQVVSDLLISCVLCELVPSAVVEAVWMVRRHLAPSALPQLMEGGVWFLQRWYTLPSSVIQRLRTIVMGENVPFFSVQVSVHFPRLLRAAIENSDNLPSAVLSQAENVSIIRNFTA